MQPIKKKPRGSALLTALFIMTLVAIVATAMSTKLQVDIYRTKLIVVHDKLYLASQGVAFWAFAELGDNKKRFTKLDPQGMISQFPQKMATLYPTVSMSGGLYDLQARFNLNNLQNKKALLGFINLLSNVAPDLSTVERMDVSLAINDWLSPYDLTRGTDHYLSYYLKLKPAYYPSHQLMSSASEFRLIKEVDAKTYLAVQPYITTLPEMTPININTASRNVLMTLNSSMDSEKANELISARGENGIKKIEKVSELLQKLNIPKDQITLESTYFLAVAHTNSDNLNFTVYTLFKRSRDNKGKLSVQLIRESFNVF